MIAYLEGIIIQKTAKNIVVKNGGIGYLVHLPSSLLADFELNQPLELFIYTKVREDDISLYGFSSSSQLNFFKDLLSVNGIGPKLALEILSSNIEKTKSAILQENISYLSKIPGIGKKTAERIIVELKNKLTPSEDFSEVSSIQEDFEDVILALSKLGYQKFEVMKILKMLPQEITETEEIITYFLKNA